MITKGIIKSIPSTLEDNKYEVRLPFFEDAIENADEIIYEATLSQAPGIIQGYSIGDIVYCAFEDNNNGRPVIIGKLYSPNLENIGGEIETLDLNVTNRAYLPSKTTIGKISSKDIALIPDIKGKVSKMGDTIYGSMTFDNTINLTKNKGVNLISDDGSIVIADFTDNLFADVMTRQCAIGSGTNESIYIKLCDISLTAHYKARFIEFRIYVGDGNTGNYSKDQNAYIDLLLQTGDIANVNYRFGGNWEFHPMQTDLTLENFDIIVTSDDMLNYSVWLYINNVQYCKPSYTVFYDRILATNGSICTITHVGNVTQTTAPTGADPNCIVNGSYGVAGKNIISLRNTAGATSFYPTIVDDVSGSKSLYTNEGFTYRTRRGTDTLEGFSGLVLGNNIAIGTALNKYGYIDLYSQSSYYGKVRTNASLTGNRVYEFPDKSGTVALLSDISGGGTAAYDGALKLQKNSGTASTLFTANQSNDTTLKYTTTSVGSASGWSAGSTPTLGTAISVDDITSWTTNTPTTPTVIDTSKFNGGSFTRGSFSGGSFTQGTDTFTAASLSSGFYTVGTAASFTQGTDSFTAASHGVDSFSAATLTPSLGANDATVSNPTTLSITFSGGSFTSGVFSGGSFTQGTDTFTANTPTAINTSKFNGGSFTQGTDIFTAATHAADSFTPASMSSGFYTAGSTGSAASLSYTARSVPNVTSVGTAPSLTVTNTTVVNGISSS